MALQNNLREKKLKGDVKISLGILWAKALYSIIV